MDPVYITMDFAWNLSSFLSCVTGQLSNSDEIINTPGHAQNGKASPGAARSLDEIIRIVIQQHSGIFDSDLDARPARDKVRDDIWGLNDIASVCREKFDALELALKAIRQTSNSSSRWPNFRAALESHWYANEVEALEKGCHDSLRALEKHVCAFTSHWIEVYQEHLKELRDSTIRQNSDILEQYRSQVGFSPQFESIPRLIQDTLERLDNIASNNRLISVADVEFLRNKLHALGNATWNVRREQAVVSSLAFDGLDVQLKSIPDVTEPMFSWAFSSVDSPQSPSVRSRLKKWLRQGNGIAQVIGGPGSGKSLLLKYLSTHQELGSVLYHWSNPKPVVVAGHFFTDQGTPGQRSLQGLLQALLRALILQLPSEAEAVYMACHSIQPEALRDYSWTIDELEQQLTRVLLSQTGTKFCLFIDALDTYEGDISKLTSFLHNLTTNGNVKICVSTKPNSGVQNGFDDLPLDIWIDGDVLRRDLELFLSVRLQTHPLWSHSPEPFSGRAELARMIAERSRNFLTGRIAVDYLKCHYRSGQTLREVKKLIGDLPLQLDCLIDYSLFGPSANLEHAGAQSFLVTLAATNPPPLAIFYFLDQEAQDADYARKITSRSRSPQQLSEILRIAKSRLERRCGGFLHVRSDNRVMFPHTAIREVFTSNHIVTALRAKAGAEHNPELSLARSYLAYMKVFKLSWGRPTFSYVYLKIPSYSRTFNDFLAVARDLDGNVKMHELLNDWERCYSEKCRSDQAQLKESDRVKANANHHFRRPILDALLAAYLRHKLNQRSGYLDSLTDLDSYSAPSVLALVVSSMFQSSAGTALRDRHIPMLRCLVQDRPTFSPNRSYSDGKPSLTPWTLFIQHTVSPSELRWSLRSGLLLHFLRNKADPNAMVYGCYPKIIGPASRAYVSSWVRLICSIGELLAEVDLTLEAKEQEACLQLLDTLITSGASSRNLPSCDFFDTPGLSHDCSWAKPLLEQLLNKEAIRLHDDASFRAEVTERFLRILSRSGHDIGWCWPILSRALTADQYALTNEKLQKANSGFENGSKPAKRASDDMVTDNETSSKRARSETEDETMTMTLRMEPGQG